MTEKDRELDKKRIYKRQEMPKLIKMLEDNQIPHELRFIHDTLQVGYPNFDESDIICDVVCHEFSYGGSDGYLEMMGLCEEEPDNVLGWLNAEEVYERISKHFNEHIGKMVMYL